MGPVLLIAGPTASGKSELALRWAERNGATVVNADSMQVYADLRVLSARPSPADEARAPHALYGFVPAREEFSVGAWLRALAPLLGSGPLVLVGGTGLYFRALTEGLVATPPVPPAIRVEWEQRADRGEDLHAALARVDPERAAQLAPADAPRLLRALELHAATGVTFSEWQRTAAAPPLLAPGSWRGLFLDPPADAVRAAIDARFLGMMGAGGAAEVERLLAFSPPLPANRGVMKAHGVPHLAAWLRGELDRDEAIRRGQADTRAYARRQRIFARKFLVGEGWTRVESPESGLEAALRLLR